MKKYEWAIIGGGIAGISIAEILSREGHSAIIIDKNDKLSKVTTREFHEWIHTGALYTLVPDRLMTLKFILGAIDDLIEYYSCYERMNLIPTINGLKIKDTKNGWFSSNYIHFKYRLKGRKITFPWLIGIARSIDLINKMKKHDWLRRRAGELDPYKKNLFRGILKNILMLIKHKNKFFDLKTTDFTTNSRLLLRDMFKTAINNGLEVSANNKIVDIEQKDKNLLIHGEKESFIVDNIAICAGSGIQKFSDVKIKTTYAPIAVVNNISKETNSFVELDYFQKNCINILTKGNGIGLIGGITLKNREDCDKYINFVINEHKKINPNLNVLEKYIGEKNEITFLKQDRNYLYHINNSGKLRNVWTIVPGKFTLAFSLAPEFYRRVYSKNPKKSFRTYIDNKQTEIIANTAWYDAVKKSESEGE
jgi:hypothetical protein